MLFFHAKAFYEQIKILYLTVIPKRSIQTNTQLIICGNISRLTLQKPLNLDIQRYRLHYITSSGYANKKTLSILPDEIGDHKKLNTSVNDSKSSVFNHHHLWCFIVPETKKVILYKLTQSHDELVKYVTHVSTMLL